MTIQRLCLVLVFWASVALPAAATHIVGGEIGMRFLQGNVYNFTLNVYYDAINADPAVINDDPTVSLNIYSRTTNRFIRSVVLPRIADELIPYSSPACASGSRVVTRRFFYSVNVELNPAQFTEAGGYYVSWERCCRNGVIDNILSPGNTGQTFYTEFPALQQAGVRFLNSTPALFAPVSDYACVNQPFTYNFGGTDADGDDVVYSLRSPVAGFSSNNNPLPNPPNPGPYPNVRFAGGFSVANMVPGNPALQVNRQTGVITVTPSRTGIFVFAVVAEEFRGGRKIGEVVREYQLVVINCPNNRPPTASLEDPERPGVALADTDTIYFRPGAGNRCADVVVGDPDPNSVLTIQLQGAGFNLPSGSGINITRNPVNLPSGGTGRSQICFPQCPPLGRPANVRQAYSFIVDVADNGCAQPRRVQRRLNVVYLPTLNTPPAVTTSLARFDAAANEYTVEINVGQTLNFDVTATDRDAGQAITLAAAGLASLPGATFNAPAAGPSPRQGQFSWRPNCNLFSPGQTQREFRVTFNSTDQTPCLTPGSGTTSVRVIVRNTRTQNTRPEISTSLPRYLAAQRLYVDTVIVGRAVRFNVTGLDRDGDLVRLSAQGQGFDLAGLRMTFATRDSVRRTTGVFQWTPGCDVLGGANRREFNLNFRAQDVDSCGSASLDSTTQVRLVVIGRPGQRPRVTPGLSFDARQQLYLDSVVVGGTFNFPVRADDPDRDSLELRIEGVNNNPAALGMVFPTVRGRPILTGNFRWPTRCGLLADPTRPQDFFVNFIVRDFDPCGVSRSDTARVRLRILPERTVNRAPVPSIDPPAVLRARRQYIDTVEIGERVSIPIISQDADNDSINLVGLPQGFSFASVGMQFRDVAGRSRISSPLTWTGACELLPDLNRGVNSRAFDIQFITRDFKDCGTPLADTVNLRLVLIFRPGANRPPSVTLAPAIGQTGPRRFARTLAAGQTLNFDVIGTDPDNDQIRLVGRPLGFTFAQVGARFTDAEGRGQVTSPFSWVTNCNLLGPNFAQRTFDIDFIVSDLRGCGPNSADTVRLTVTLTPEANITPPRLTGTSVDASGRPRDLNNMRLIPGEEVVINLEAFDGDLGVVSISGQGVDFNFADFGMVFTPVNGTNGRATATLRWTPTCEQLAQRQRFDFNFIARDQNVCAPPLSSPTLFARINLLDFTLGAGFQPPNVFTPNGDGLNDAFRIPGLPRQSCTDEFLSIEIFNRWGVRVFTSTSNDFAWTGEGYPPGVYYYHLNFRSRQYKGTVTMLGPGQP